MIWPTPYPMTTTLHLGGASGTRLVLPVVPPADRPRPVFAPPEKDDAVFMLKSPVPVLTTASVPVEPLVIPPVMAAAPVEEDLPPSISRHGERKGVGGW